MLSRLLTAIICTLTLFTSTAIAAPTPKLWPYWQTHAEKRTVKVKHDAWSKLLKKYIKRDKEGINRFAYSKVSEEDKRVLSSYIDYLKELPVATLTTKQQMAYWINLYNALTVKLILDNYPVTSITKIKSVLKFWQFGPWDEELITISGKALTLNDIEHRILRPIFKDNRVHYAINCASLGCPNLNKKAFTRKNLDLLLNKSAIDFINNPRAVAFDDGTLKLSSIYDWFKVDFGTSEQNVIKHLMQYARPNLKKRLKGYEGEVSYHYDWGLNEAK